MPRNRKDTLVPTPTTADGLLAAPADDDPTAVPVTPGRYPFTYAYDHLRAHRDEYGIPDDVGSSRGDMAGWLRDRLGLDSQDPSYVTLVRGLADRHIAEHGYVWPAGTSPSTAVAERGRFDGVRWFWR